MRSHAGDEDARNALVMHNQRLLIHLVSKFHEHHPESDIQDLMSEGNLGLMHAAELFDPAMGFHFSTYMKHWVLQALGRYFYENGTIRIPQHQAFALRRIRSAKEQGACVDDIPAMAGVSGQDVQLLLPYLAPIASLDTRIVNKDGSEGDSFGSFISESDTDEKENVLLLDLLKTMLEKLPQKYRDVLVRRYGLYGEKPATLQELADEYGITKERVRQLEMKALSMCRRYI